MDQEQDMLEVAPEATEPVVNEAMQRLQQLAGVQGDLSDLLDPSQLGKLGQDVVHDYECDETERADWREKAERALDRAAQEKLEEKDYPWKGAANVSYPMLTVAALQFAARAYPAVVKNDEAIQVKVFGSPPASPEPEALQALQRGDQQAAAYLQALAQQRQAHAAKKGRARRVGDYLNYCLFYGEDDWEGDTDALLHQLPIVGCAFRKTYAMAGKLRSSYVPALRLVVPQSAKTLATSPRVTEEIPDVYPYEIEGRMRSGLYRQVELAVDPEDDQAPRVLLEQHRMEDLDGDGLAEPYIVTVDHESCQVLRIERAWSAPEMVNGRVVGFDRWMPYTKYGFIPDLKGRFYDIGFGHLLDQISAVVNTMINQLIDAGHAQIAGGGFISSGMRLQSAGQTAKLTWRPGEYKVVNVPPGQLQASVYERTFPNPSPVAFQLLDMMLGAIRDITSTKDVLTGEQPTSAPVGTTLAMIEQGLQVFSSIYKRVYRGMRQEFAKVYQAAKVAGDVQGYMTLLDDPQADFAKDFAQDGRDILPVSDPSVATKMQSMAQAQMLLQLRGTGLNDNEIVMRALTAFGIDDPEELLPPPVQGPPPDVAAKAKKDEAGAMKDMASAGKLAAETLEIQRGMNADPNAGGVPGMALGAPDQMGVQGAGGGF